LCAQEPVQIIYRAHLEPPLCLHAIRHLAALSGHDSLPPACCHDSRRFVAQRRSSDSAIRGWPSPRSVSPGAPAASARDRELPSRPQPDLCRHGHPHMWHGLPCPRRKRSAGPTPRVMSTPNLLARRRPAFSSSTAAACRVGCAWSVRTQCVLARRSTMPAAQRC
jgi:hypothetical protein